MMKRIGLFLVNLLLFCPHSAKISADEMVVDVGGTLTSRRGMDASMASVFGDAPVVHEVRDLQIPGPDAGSIAARLYRPQSTAHLPLMLYIHGGGWVFGSIASHDALCRSYANALRAVVVSVEYPLAPEHPFPAALEACYAAALWAHANARELGGDPDTFAVAGDSAGGNLAAAVTLMARERGGSPPICFQLLASPVLQSPRAGMPSYTEMADAYPSAKGMLDLFKAYAPDGNWSNPLVSPLAAADFSGLPAALIFSAEYDVLRDEAEAYGAKLVAAGVGVTVRRFVGAHHAAMSMRTASTRDFQFGLALAKAAWQHAIGQTEELWELTDSSKL